MHLFSIFLQPHFPDRKAFVTRMINFYQQLFDQYEDFKNETVNHRFVKHKHILGLVKTAREAGFAVDEIGKSFQNRSIYQIRVGNGPKKLLLWSQMHGDEPSATLAILDMINFFKQRRVFNQQIDRILTETSIFIIPMLNPDGAQQYQRRNHQDIDINRDALRLTTPEAHILKAARDRIDPEFGFNLHDQSVYYAAGESKHPASISFLAPAYDYERSINDVRRKAMQLIVRLNEIIQDFIPNQVARYDDSFEPRAFGDNIQKWGTSTILIESGGYKNDPEKQFLRKINFMLLIAAAWEIANENYSILTIEPYEKIPENKTRLFDLLIRKVNIVNNNNRYQTDIGIERSVISSDEKSLFKGQITDVGDLSTRYGYHEISTGDLTIYPGKIYSEVFDWDDLQDLNFRELLEEGFTTLQVHKIPPDTKISPYPVNIVSSANPITHDISLDTEANFTLHRNEEIVYTIINGFLYSRDGDNNLDFNGIIF